MLRLAAHPPRLRSALGARVLDSVVLFEDSTASARFGNEVTALTLLFLFVLVVAWLTVFLPSVMRARRSSPLFSTEGFRKRMSSIAPGAGREVRAGGGTASGGRSAEGKGRWVVMPQSPDRVRRLAWQKAQRRRKYLLLVLVVAVVASALAGAIVGGAMWEVHLAFDASLAVYVVLLVEAKKRRAQHAATVSPLERARRRLTRSERRDEPADRLRA